MLITPIVGLFLTFSAYAITSFVMTNLGSQTEEMATIATIIRILLGFLGIVFVVWAIIGIPVGVLYLVRKELPEGQYDKRSGKGSESEVPKEVKRWSWGGFGISIIWGLYHRVWISLLTLIPLAGLIVAIYLGIKGNELAWRKNHWKSVEDLHKSQRKWGIAGVIVLITLTFFYIFSAIIDLASDTTEPQSINEAELIDTPSTFEPIESFRQRRLRLGLPEPYETVLRLPFPQKLSQAAGGDFTGTVGWEMSVSALPINMPSTRETGFFLGSNQVAVRLDDKLQLICYNTSPTYQKILTGCRPLEYHEGVLYQQFGEDWKYETFSVGAKVEMYELLPCTRDLIEALEACEL